MIKKRKKTEKNEGKQKKKTKKNKKKQRKKQRNYEAMICLSLCSNYLKLYIIIFASPPKHYQKLNIKNTNCDLKTCIYS